MRLFLLLFAFAQWGFAATEVDRAELTKRLSFYHSLSKLTTKFHQTKHLKDVAISLESDGELTVIFPKRVIWKVIHPSPLTVSLEGAQLEITAKDGETNKINVEGEGREAMKALVAWLKLDPDELYNSYRITRIDKNDTYRFEPKAPGPIAALQMQVRAGSHIEKLDLEERSGDRLEIRFEKPRLERAHAP
jgi:hypothetical protein